MIPDDEGFRKIASIKLCERTSMAVVKIMSNCNWILISFSLLVLINILIEKMSNIITLCV